MNFILSIIIVFVFRLSAFGQHFIEFRDLGGFKDNRSIDFKIACDSLSLATVTKGKNQTLEIPLSGILTDISICNDIANLLSIYKPNQIPKEFKFPRGAIVIVFVKNNERDYYYFTTKESSFLFLDDLVLKLSESENSKGIVRGILNFKGRLLKQFRM